MRYQIPPDILPDARPKRVVMPLVLMFVSMTAGAGVGFLLGAINARNLGCRDQRKQQIILGIAWVFIVAVAMIIKWLDTNLDEADTTHLIASILHSATVVSVMWVAIYLVDRQSILYNLHTRERSNLPKNIALAIGLVVLTFVASIILDGVPYLRLLMIGGSVWTAP